MKEMNIKPLFLDNLLTYICYITIHIFKEYNLMIFEFIHTYPHDFVAMSVSVSITLHGGGQEVGQQQKKLRVLLLLLLVCFCFVFAFFV